MQRDEDTSSSADNIHLCDQRRIVWDDTSARTLYADLASVAGTREEVALLFGMSQVEAPDPNEVRAQIQKRIVLSPFVAKRFAVQLSNMINSHESKCNLIDMEPVPSERREPAAPIPKNPPAVNPERRPKEEDLLFQLIKGLNVEVSFERSFKVTNAVLLDNRYLLGVSKKAVGQGAYDRLTEICRLMGMPGNLLDIFKHDFPQGNYVHFGLEQNENTTVHKVYLEFFDAINERISKSRHRPGPALLHLGLKWDASDPARQSVTHYTWHPWISFAEIRRRFSCMLDPQADVPAKQAADELIALAMARIPARDILYLEVTEEGNPRRSFDINVYRANLHVAEVYPLLSMLCRRHSISFDTFHSLYDGIKTKRFGHLAGGIDRAGKGFFTVYYGVEGMCGESSRGPLPGYAGMAVGAQYELRLRRRPVIGAEQTDGKASHLLQLVRGLGLRARFERSFKFLNRILLTDRFLIGVRRPDDSGGQDDAIVDICRKIDMPEDYLERFRSDIHEANHVLFGFERNENGRVYKAYLEFNNRLKEALIQEPRPEHVVMYDGFKWDVSDHSRRVVTQYTAFHILHARDISTRISSDFYRASGKNPYRIVDDILDLAGSRSQPGEILYFEASEESNPRSSFDVNIYGARLRMLELYPMLLNIARHYSVEIKRLNELYEAVKTHTFGHLSGGWDRKGRDFLTLYFSEKREQQAVIEGRSGGGTQV